MNYISKNDYEKLHEYKLQPLSIKIDVDNFLSEIIKFDEYFRPWGDKYNDLPRYGLPLINENGKLNNEIEPACWPLDRYNFIVKQKYEDTPENFIEFYNNVKNNNIDNLITELHFKNKTPALDIPSLTPLNDIKKYMTRSCILKWGKMANFKPHFDTWHPVKWLRLWGTTSPEKMYLRYLSEETDDGFCMYNGITKKHEIYVEEKNIEPGRLYLHDSLLWHDAFAFDEPVYQFFISLSLESLEWIQKNKI